MPQYHVTDPTTNRSVTLTGDSPPTEAELTEIFARLNTPTQPAAVPKPPARVPFQYTQAGQQVEGAKGIAKGAATTAIGLGELAYKYVPGVSKLSDTLTGLAGYGPRPGEQPGDTFAAARASVRPTNAAQNVGFYAEQAGEFAVPGARMAGVSRGASLPFRAALEGATAAGVAGAQSGGDPYQMGAAGTLGFLAPPVGAAGRFGVNAARRMAAGAQEGGVGGAVAGFLRSTVPIKPKSMVLQALKPRASLTKIDATLERALPELKITEAELGKPIAGIDDLLAATKAAKKRVRAQYDEMAGPARERGSTVDLTPVADAMEQSIPNKVKLENPKGAKSIVSRASLYRRKFGLEDAETLLRETNAELDGYYAMFPQAQRSALASNPKVAALEAQAKALRTAIYGVLDHPGQGAAARELNRRYGALLDVEDIATRRLNVSRRQQPESLAEQIAGAGAVGDLVRGTWKLAHGNIMGAADIASARAQRAGARFIKEQQTTDALIRRAFASYEGKPVPVQMPPRQPGLATIGEQLQAKVPPQEPPPAAPVVSGPAPLPKSPPPPAYAGPERRATVRQPNPAEDAVYQRMREKLAAGVPTGTPEHRAVGQQLSQLESSRQTAAQARGETPLPRTAADAPEAPARLNPFRARLQRAEAEYASLTRSTAREQAMGQSFPLGAGFGSGRSADASIDRAVRAEKVRKEANRLKALAEAFDRGEVNWQGRPISTKKRPKGAK